jgi:hypothetical protein
MRRGWMLCLALAAAVLAAPAAASAASVAYIDGGNVWVSSLDGSQKHRLTTDGEWDEVAQSDNGRIAGVRREGATFGQFNILRVWEANGKQAFEGTLTKGLGWVQYLFPLSLDWNATGTLIAYGYQNVTPSFPVNQMEEGTYLITGVQPQVTDPVKFVSRRYPTFVGSRLVVHSGGQVAVQRGAGGPGATEFDPWLDPIPGFDLGRTDVSANGRIAALEMNKYDFTITQTAGFIDMTPVNALGDVNIRSGACILPSQGFARDVSLSQDGTRVAWADQGGVWVAGVPDFLGNGPPSSVPGNSLCVLTAPKVLISATAKYPSIGGANVTDMLPAPPGGSPALPPAPTGPAAPPSGTAPTALVAKLPSSAPVAVLRRGLAIRVGAPRAGLVSIAATVPGKRLGLRGAAARRPALIAKGTARVASARVIAVRLKLTALGRAKSARLKGARATVRIKLGTTVLTRSLRIR